MRCRLDLNQAAWHAADTETQAGMYWTATRSAAEDNSHHHISLHWWQVETTKLVNQKCQKIILKRKTSFPDKIHKSRRFLAPRKWAAAEFSVIKTRTRRRVLIEDIYSFNCANALYFQPLKKTESVTCLTVCVCGCVCLTEWERGGQGQASLNLTRLQD